MLASWDDLSWEREGYSHQEIAAQSGASRPCSEADRVTNLGPRRMSQDQDEDPRAGMLHLEDASALRVLEDENKKLKRPVADLSLDRQAIQDMPRESPEAFSWP